MAGEQDGGVDEVVEEFAIWKKNSPFLYDLLISHSLEWPSLTVDWVPSAPFPHQANPSLAVHKLVLGTHTSEDVPNYLMVADAILPVKASETRINITGENPIMPKVSDELLPRAY